MGEVIVKGLFGLLQATLSFGFMVLLLWAILQGGSRFFGAWGQPNGHYFILDPRRLWCKHTVSHYQPGAHGLLALWCSACGRKVNRK